MRQAGPHVVVVEFAYARTMEFTKASTAEQKSKLREVSARSLEALFEDWKYGSTSCAVPLYKRVKQEFLRGLARGSGMSEEIVDGFLRSTRFMIVDAPASEMPIRGRIVVDTGSYDEAQSLAKVYIDCIDRYIKAENENWAVKATMDRGLVVQNLECEVRSQKQRLSLKQRDGSELNGLKMSIASNEVAVCRAKAELAEAKRKYHATHDMLMIFVDRER